MIPLIILCSHFTAKATNYYFSATGNDVNDGTSIHTAWKTLSKFNSAFKLFQPGDSILFKRGDVFYGSLNIIHSGKNGLPIIIASYGRGPLPVITGFTQIEKWNNLGNNIWESAEEISSLSSTNIVTVKGINTAMGRFPNNGYVTYQNFTKTSITSASLNHEINWKGAIAVIKKNNWIIDSDTIIAQSNHILVHTAHSAYNGQNNYGFFIEDDPKTLDQQNEWYYNSNTHKLKIYSKYPPTDVKVSTIDTLVSISAANYIAFSNISFTGSNMDAFAINFSNHINIFNCSINFSGKNAVITRGGSCSYFKLINTIINHTNNNAIDLGGASPNCVLSNDTIKNTGVLPGMGANSDKTLTAIQSDSDNGIIENCFIDSTGYNAIDFSGNNTIIRNNFISNFCMIKFDGGGIYTFIGKNENPFTGQKVLNNIVINGIGNAKGTTEKIPLVHGIYIDEGAANIEIAGNTSANNSYSGLYFHNTYSINAHNNILYNNGHCQFLMAGFNEKHPERNLLFTYNTLVSKKDDQKIECIQSGLDDISNFGEAENINHNFYLMPTGNTTIAETSINYKKIFQRNFSEWQSYSGFDKHSATLITSDVLLLYNSSSLNKTVNLKDKYVDVKNTSYSGKIILPPFSSLLLLKKNSSQKK